MPHVEERKFVSPGPSTIASSTACAAMRAEPVPTEGGVGAARRVVDTAVVRAIANDAAVLVILTAATAAVYVWTKAPLYNPFGTIDPWLYTALWTNFDQVYESFPRTYYISRVPWIVPGYVLNGIFDDARTAALVLHTAFFLGGGVLFYVFCRRWLGVPASAIGYVALIGSQMYFAAHRWDYQEGGVLTYMIAAYAFSLVRTQSPRMRPASLALGGFFAAAMVTTRIIDVVYLVGLPLLYVAVSVDVPWAARLRQFARDVAAFAAGAAALLVAGGLFARSHGEEFLFFMPQVRVVRATSGEYNQIPVDAWLPLSPYFWVPLFVVLFSAVVLAVGPKTDRVARRVLAAATLWLSLLYAAFAAWQFLGHGWLFNLTYYFSSFLVPTLLCLTAAASVLIGSRVVSRRTPLHRDRICPSGPRAGRLDLPIRLRTPHCDCLPRRFVRRDVRDHGRRDSSRRPRSGAKTTSDRCDGCRHGVLRSGLRRRRELHNLVVRRV